MLPRIASRLPPLTKRACLPPAIIRPLSTSSPSLGKRQPPVPPRPTVNEEDITEVFIHGGGTGGQKINKTASKVQLKHLPTGMVLTCQETRSRTENRKIARRKLAERLEEMEKGELSRVAVKRERASKKKASKAKKARRKYRKLEEEKNAAAVAAGGPVVGNIVGQDGEEEEEGEDGEDSDDDDEDDDEEGEDEDDPDVVVDIPEKRSPVPQISNP
ncbi:hypothetical protein K402DRAFT_390404 [Aulographum hederae CBS 113979]|uniref:Prokaryotic-type class I peptide chain release factors domain-containing protein n=1 Tax=Aulographum hederae CBS 113979 TaxID=1176131 RepID=A0A6G1HAL7_9PEZI|nr:hypothetical protein K402DRAFT_390404 [Aulographum hederae CBS 113979]